MNADLLLFLQAWTGAIHLPGEEEARLLVRLDSDAAFRAECAAELRLLGTLKVVQAPQPRWLALRDVLGLSEEPTPTAGRLDFTELVMGRIHPQRPSTQRGAFHKRRAFSLISAAVLFLCAFGMLWAARSGTEVEVLSASESADPRWKAGNKLRTRALRVMRGALEVRLSSGVRLHIQAPAELDLVGPMAVRLALGKITANVGDRGRGFTLETPEARIVDLGTVFGVDASRAEKTDVVVFNGQVELYEKGGPHPVALLNQGEGVRIERNRRSSRIVSITDPSGAGSWSAQDATATPQTLITTVGDSMSADEEQARKWPSLRNFYRIVPGGLREGALAFSDTLDEWSDIPEALVGADQVRTFAVDRYNWWMRLRIEISRPCELFVFVDKRNPVPQWVADSFSDTGESLLLNVKPDQLGGRVAARFPYAIWRRVEERPGAVTLGAPYENPPEDRKSFNPNNMFGVAARPLR